MKTDDLIEMFKNMTLTEITEFRRQFEDTFNVSADAPVAITYDLPTGGDEEEQVQTEFDVILDGVGDRKIEAIKIVRAMGLGLGLKEAKNLVDSAPVLLMSKVTQATAEEAKTKLGAVGATVSIR